MELRSWEKYLKKKSAIEFYAQHNEYSFKKYIYLKKKFFFPVVLKLLGEKKSEP